MATPENIKSVERPKNTRVKNINGKYKVISRTSIRDGKRVIPIELGVIGEIIDGKYVAYPNPNIRNAEEARNAYRKKHGLDVETSDINNNIVNGVKVVSQGCKPKKTIYTIKVSGPIDLMNKMGDGLLQSLTDVFGIEDAKFIYVIALLRAAFGEIKNRDLDEEYEASKASVIYPGVSLSEKTVCTNLKRLGYNTLNMIIFWRNRVKAYMDKGVTIVDGALLDFNSQGSVYSEFSRKGKVKGSKDGLVLTAYSLELQEPLCEEFYHGNMNEMVAYEDFSKKYKLDSAIVVARPAFSEEELNSDVEETDNDGKKMKKLVDVKLFNKGYGSEDVICKLREGGHHFLVAIKNDRKDVQTYELDNPCEYLNEYKEDVVMYKKVRVAENKFLYAFKCSRIGSIQNAIYVVNETKNKRFSPEKFNIKQSSFGLIVFESDLDLKPFEVYEAYDDRWKIEPYEKLRKSIMENCAINVHSDPSVRATTFINGISNIMGCRLRKIMMQTGLSKTYSTKEVLRRLSYFTEQMDEDGNWYATARLKKNIGMAETLGIE